jgi:hypothetical protein
LYSHYCGLLLIFGHYPATFQWQDNVSLPNNIILQ